MKREFIKEQIESLIPYPEGDFSTLADDLTALFIQLSEERCKEQKSYCFHAYSRKKGGDSFEIEIGSDILNAPFPTLD